MYSIEYKYADGTTEYHYGESVYVTRDVIDEQHGDYVGNKCHVVTVNQKEGASEFKEIYVYEGQRLRIFLNGQLVKTIRHESYEMAEQRKKEREAIESGISPL